MENKKLYEKYKDVNLEVLNEYFINLCMYNNLEDIEYLLISSDLKEHADINSHDGLGIYYACTNGNLELAKYLLSSPKLKRHADIHINDDVAFYEVCINNHIEIAEYLIFDYKIEKTKHIKAFLEKNQYYEVESMFRLRGLNEEMDKDLPYSTNKKLRV